MKRLLLAVATVLLVVPTSASAQATSGVVAPDMQVDGALAERVRASLAAHFGDKRAARIAIRARDGAVRVEAPELSLRDRERVGVEAPPVVGQVGPAALGVAAQIDQVRADDAAPADPPLRAVEAERVEPAGDLPGQAAGGAPADAVSTLRSF